MLDPIRVYFKRTVLPSGIALVLFVLVGCAVEPSSGDGSPQVGEKNLPAAQQKPSATQAKMDFARMMKELKERQARIPEEISALPVEQSPFLLYSLDPDGGMKDVVNSKLFHGYRIHGKADIKNAEDKRTLIDAFVKGIRESDLSSALCFNPRHGIRLVVNSSTNDFVICFEGRQVMVYGFDDNKDILTADSSAAVFNDFLDKFHLKRAKKTY